MAKKQINATAKLFIDFKDAKSDAAKFVTDIKQKLNDIENAADKFTVFKDVVSYIGDIDKALGTLKANNKDVFNQMFGNLDSGLRKQLEGLFGISGSQLGQIDALREKLNTLTPKSSIKEIRGFAKELNALFTSVGRDAPFGNIDMEFSGRTRPEDIDRLSGALGNFATVWDDVVRKIGRGFGVGSGGVTSGGLSKEIQAEVDKLQKQITQLHALKKELQTTLDNKHAFDNIEDIKLDTKPTEEGFKRLIKQYQDLTEASHNLMEGTSAYNSNLAQRAKIGLQISAIRDADPDFDTKKASDIIDNDQFELVLDNFEKNIKKIHASIDKEISKIQIKIEDTIANANAQMSGTGGFGNMDDSFKQATDASGKFVNKLEYIQLMATQIQRLFSAMSDEEVKLEYKILMNGHEVNLKAGGAKEVDFKTSIEALLGNLTTGTTVSMHNHPGGTSSKYNHFDLNEAISSFYSGTSKLSAIIGDDGITTLDLAKVKMEDALQVYEKLKSMKVSNISTDKLNKLFTDINVDYSNVAQHWDASEFVKLATYIYDVENNAISAIAPLERFKNVVTMAFGKQINWDSYGQLLEEFDIDNVGNIFNQLAKMEGVKIHVDDTTTSSLDAVIEQINQQKQAFVELRQEANITYKDIQRQVQAYLSEVASGGTGNKALEYFKTYFGTADFLDITDLFAQLQDGMLNPDNVANQIASYFPKIDPEEFVINSNVVAPIQDAKTTLKEFFALADEIQHKSFPFDDAEGNVEIGRYTERLETAQSALIQFAQAGEYTKEELQEMESAFKSAQQRLSDYTTHYDGYGNGDGEYDYTYEDEYKSAEREKERLNSELRDAERQYKSEREENERLRTEIEEMRQKEQQDENQGSVSESSIKEENEALKQQKNLVEEIVKIRNDLGLNASQTKLGVTDGKDWLGDGALDNITKKQKELHGYIQWLAQIEMKEKRIGQLTDEEIAKKQELVQIVQGMALSVRYKDGSHYSTSNFGDYDQNLSEQIEQLQQVISLRKKISYGAYWTGNYGTMGDTFSGDNISTLVGDSISQFESVQEFDASVIGQLVREYQYLHEEMTRCLTVGEQVPQSTLDRMKWFENIDATQLQNILPSLTELQGKITAVQEGIEHNITTNADEQFYDAQIQNLQELIQLQKEYLSLGGPEETNDYDTSLHYSTEQLQERLDRYTQLKNGAKEVAKLQEAFPDIDFKRSGDFAYIADILREGIINYQDALKRVNQELEKQKQLELERASIQSTDETEEYKAEANAIEQRNEALKEGNALKSQEDVVDHRGIANTGLTTGIDIDKEDIAAEIQQLETLKAILVEVEQAVQNKTRAFQDEGLVVEQTVSREIEALRELVLALAYIKSALDAINDSFGGSNTLTLPAGTDVVNKSQLVNTSGQNSYALEATLQTTNGYLKSILEALSGNKAIDGLVEPLKNAVAELKNVASGIVEHQKAQQTDKGAASARIANNYGQLSSITGNTLSGMGDNIQIENMKALADNIVRVRGAVQDTDGVWKGFVVDINESNNAIINAIDEQSAFAKSLNETAEAAKEAEKAADNDVGKKTADRIEKLAAQKTKERELQKILGQVNLEKGTLGFNFNARGLNAEQTEIAGLYDALIAEVDKYEIAVKEGYQAELDGINASKNALFEKIDAYKTANNIIDAGKTGNKKAPGATVVKNATTKYNALKNAANTEELQGSMVAQQKLAQYAAAYEKLINLQKQYKVGQVLSPDQEQEFNDARVACNNYAKEVEKLLKLHQKARGEGDQSKRYEFEGDFQDTDVGRQQVFKEFLDQYDSSSVTFEKFDDNFNKVIYTVNNGDGTFTKMTATINSTRTAIDAFVGETKEAKSVLGKFFDQFKGKLKSVGAYMMATVSIHDALRVVKQGVQYVKEIDLALTELKKVTNETEQSYTNFLNTASQTASKIGSTVADFTNATADFARLGYNMEQAAELAKAASVYKNVGDGINDIATASESIISTMKAFGIEADSAMGIVDRFNEVGKYIAQAA